MIVRRADGTVTRVEISANGITRFYVEEQDLKDWEEHLYQQGHVISMETGEDFSKMPYSSATYSSLYQDELLKIVDGTAELMETTYKDKIYLIKIIFNMFINKWGHPDVPYQL